MDVEIGKAPAPETPASCMAEQMVEHVVAIMAICGIESIESKKYVAGFGSRLHVSMVPFHEAPDGVTAQGVVVKDAIAQILSVANLTRVVIKPKEGELSDMRDSWSKALADALAANGGSSQRFSSGSGQDEKEPA